MRFLLKMVLLANFAQDVASEEVCDEIILHIEF